MVAQWLPIMLQLPGSEEEEAAENKVVKFDNVVKFNNIGCRIQQRCRILQFLELWKEKQSFGEQWTMGLKMNNHGTAYVILCNLHILMLCKIKMQNKIVKGT